jgi:hypothetical protein
MGGHRDQSPPLLFAAVFYADWCFGGSEPGAVTLLLALDAGSPLISNNFNNTAAPINEHEFLGTLFDLT